jgi:hypothetical protein
MPNTNFCETRGKPFRFMDLPIDIRLMVYERLPRIIRHTPSRQTQNLEDGDITTGLRALILITRHVPTAILATCRTIHAEANGIVMRLLRTFILEQEPRLIYDIDDLQHEDNPIFEVFTTKGMMNLAITAGQYAFSSSQFRLTRCFRMVCPIVWKTIRLTTPPWRRTTFTSSSIGSLALPYTIGRGSLPSLSLSFSRLTATLIVTTRRIFSDPEWFEMATLMNIYMGMITR